MSEARFEVTRGLLEGLTNQAAGLLAMVMRDYRESGLDQRPAVTEMFTALRMAKDELDAADAEVKTWMDRAYAVREAQAKERELLDEAASLIMAVDTVAKPHDGNKPRGEGAGETRDVHIPDYWFDETNNLLARIREVTYV